MFTVQQGFNNFKKTIKLDDMQLFAPAPNKEINENQFPYLGRGNCKK